MNEQILKRLWAVCFTCSGALLAHLLFLPSATAGDDLRGRGGLGSHGLIVGCATYCGDKPAGTKCYVCDLTNKIKDDPPGTAWTTYQHDCAAEATDGECSGPGFFSQCVLGVGLSYPCPDGSITVSQKQP